MRSNPFPFPARLAPTAILALLAGAAFAANDSIATLPVVEVAAPAVRPAPPAILPGRAFPIERSEEPGTEILGREEIQALEPRDVFDLLDKATGLNVTFQGRRSPYFVDERGGGSLTYVLDGAVLPSQSNRILQNIPLEAIQEVRIVRGATSLALGPSIAVGSSASGSALNTGFVLISTRRPAKLEAKASAWCEQSLSQHYADGQSVWVGTPLGDSTAISGHVGGMVSRSDFPSKASWFDGRASTAVLATAGIRAGSFHLDGSAYTDSGRFEMQRGLTLADTLDASRWFYDPLVSTVLDLRGGIDWNRDQATVFTAYWTKFEQHEVNASFRSPNVTTRDFREKNIGAGVRHDARVLGALLQAGFQASRSSAFGPNTNNAFNDWETSLWGGSISASRSFLDDRLSVDAGWRRDLKHIDHSATAAGRLKANRDVDLPPADLFAAGASWRDGIWTADARGMVGTAGTSNDFDLRTRTGNPLDAEAQQRAELTGGASPFPWLRPSLTWFAVYIQNQKSATTDTFSVDGQTYYFYTQADSRRQGLEFRLQGDFARWLSWDAAWTRLLVNETWTAGATSDNIGTAQPENIVNGRITAKVDGWKATVSAKAVDEYDQSTSSMGTANNVHLGDYLRIDASLSKEFAPLGHFLSCEVYGRNLANDRYSTRYTTGYYRDRGLTVGSRFTVGI